MWPQEQQRGGSLKSIWLIALVVIGGCRQEPAGAVSREQFIDVMVALRELDMETDEAAEFDPRRDSILRAANLTDSALIEFARRHGSDVAYMAEVWDSIARRLASGDTIMR